MKAIKSMQSLPQDTVYDEIDSPVGRLTIVASTQGLHVILWDSYPSNVKDKEIIDGLKQSKKQKVISQTKTQLQEYFQGKRKMFDLPLAPEGTDFQKQVWLQLRKIPYAQTISYGEQARRIGDKKKARAVGMANGVNPISIIVPCHRVIGSNGKLTGFGGGLDRKQWLLDHEKQHGNK